tara:strand:- start:767 stop:2932 length:2166 start_codon:yes stop_codon:yes gene_type:complete
MAGQTSKIDIQFLTKGEGEVAKAFKRLRGETTRLNRDFKSLSKDSIAKVKNEFNKLGAGARNSINGMQAQRNALNGLRNMADVTSIEFKQLTADIARLDAQMRKAGAGTTGFKGKLKGFAKGAGAIAAGGIFGGPEGAVGGAIGLKVGGPAGAAVGAAIGAQVGMVRQSIGEIAIYNAALERQRRALKLVIGDLGKYNKAQKFLANTSKKLAIPQDVIVRQFTSLTASVVGAGQSVSDAEEVFQAIAAGIRGTGGNLEDMKAAMRATSQVFSKGKVSAEELRQQLGERLPGAFTLFAKSMDKTPAELDKALEQGKVTLDDFMKFAKTLFATYGENAEILAQGPEAAGDRLQTSISDLKDNLGEPLSKIGAMFQNMATTAVNSLNDISEAVGDRVAEGLTRDIGRRTENIANLQKETKKAFDDLRKASQGQKITLDTGSASLGSITVSGKNAIDLMRKRYDEAKAAEDENLRKIIADKKRRDGILKDNMEPVKISGMLFHPVTYQYLGQADGSADPSKDSDKEAPLNNIELGAKAYFDTIGDFAKQTQDAVTNAFKGMEDALVKFVLTGKLNFSDLARSIISDLARIAVRSALLNFLSPFSFFDRVTGGKSAKGNVFDAGNKISKFAYGGIVSKPTIFPMQDGAGLMGEAGPEAIMPLKRGRDGKLGVISNGGGSMNIVVNVDASGSSVEGDEQGGRELGRLISSAIQSELINQKRPGGLLA